MSNSTPFRIAINGYGKYRPVRVRALYKQLCDYLQVVAINSCQTSTPSLT